ncbi:MAG: DoxX family protein [Longimicrobiales bacterium]
MRSLLRIVTGLLFMQHGAQKLFAVLGRDTAVETFSLLWYAGVLEFWGGLFVVFGLLSRHVALVLAAEMAVAYFLRHAPRGFFPIQNGGEPAALFGLIFLYIAARGGGAFSLDELLAARRRRRAAE